jgi:tRNA pseudouridine55 synthase
VTSHDVVDRIRRLLSKAPPTEGGGLKGVKVGHSGTLDPFATGLLLILVGRATRVQRVLMALPKRYQTIARLGWTSTTGDRDGEIAPGRTPPEPLVLPTGTLLQRPHPYSAVKVGGRRAYARSRAGEAVELPERQVEVNRFELLWRDQDRAGLVIECSTGTYVRSLVADLGDAYCLELRRTGIGPFDVGDADPDRVLSLTDALAFLPEVRLEGEQAQRASHGVAVPGEGEGEGMIRLTDDAGLIALALPRPDGLLKPTVGFRS